MPPAVLAPDAALVSDHPPGADAALAAGAPVPIGDAVVVQGDLITDGARVAEDPIRTDVSAGSTADPHFGAPALWQTALRSQGATFSALAPGSRIGLVAEGAVGNDASPGARMLVWEATAGGVAVRLDSFAGFEATDVDILIAADPAALAALREALATDVLARMRRLIRAGELLFFARKNRRDLEQAGYEELLEQLGFAFLGACR